VYVILVYLLLESFCGKIMGILHFTAAAPETFVCQRNEKGVLFFYPLGMGTMVGGFCQRY